MIIQTDINERIKNMLSIHSIESIAISIIKHDNIYLLKQLDSLDKDLIHKIYNPFNADPTRLHRHIISKSDEPDLCGSIFNGIINACSYITPKITRDIILDRIESIIIEGIRSNTKLSPKYYSRIPKFFDSMFVDLDSMLSNILHDPIRLCLNLSDYEILLKKA
jgi:hypothetical protein